jgi:hypothetical protein
MPEVIISTSAPQKCQTEFANIDVPIAIGPLVPLREALMKKGSSWPRLFGFSCGLGLLFIDREVVSG